MKEERSKTRRLKFDFDGFIGALRKAYPEINLETAKIWLEVEGVHFRIVLTSVKQTAEIEVCWEEPDGPSNNKPHRTRVLPGKNLFHCNHCRAELPTGKGQYCWKCGGPNGV